ncbi:hypothetical protein B0T26DRAFT_869921 [Lasiosphaeria miniovina]|uniref:Uncharacterized protein n=1 Tax=Lasiosphaeria miniovina TaxID=1954250 RepID=A0AA40ATC8_9PEZI|nr:uncharacterized protein B0T26DRAFT_869921 [Lasiosphaeria miniovina]KAK0721652.1 hypothetical protein B0T26DRAFT_869921 [Lasiosphaeria miniovina]
MRLAIVFSTVISAAAVLVQASPAQNDAAVADYIIKWCQNANYQGTCVETRRGVVGKCYNVDAANVGKLGSVQHDPGLTCYYYSKAACDGSFAAQAQNTTTLPPGNQIKSWMCDLTSQLSPP